MDKLSQVLTEMDDDLTVEVTVRTKIHDDIPRGFADELFGVTGVRHYKNVECVGGAVTKSIVLHIAD